MATTAPPASRTIHRSVARLDSAPPNRCGLGSVSVPTIDHDERPVSTEQGRPPPTLRRRADSRPRRGDVHRHRVDRRRRRRAVRRAITLNAIELDIASCTVDGAPATWTLDPQTERLVIVPERAARRRARRRSTSRSPAPSTTSCAGSIAARSSTTTATSTSSPPRRCRRPTAGGRSRAGTSPSSRPCSRSRWSSTRR